MCGCVGGWGVGGCVCVCVGCVCVCSYRCILLLYGFAFQLSYTTVFCQSFAQSKTFILIFMDSTLLVLRCLEAAHIRPAVTSAPCYCGLVQASLTSAWSSMISVSVNMLTDPRNELQAELNLSLSNISLKTC